MEITKNNHSICYVAFGELYIAQALLSIKTLRKFDKETKIILLTNIQINLNSMKSIYLMRISVKIGITKRISINTSIQKKLHI